MKMNSDVNRLSKYFSCAPLMEMRPAFVKIYIGYECAMNLIG